MGYCYCRFKDGIFVLCLYVHVIYTSTNCKRGSSILELHRYKVAESIVLCPTRLGKQKYLTNKKHKETSTRGTVKQRMNTGCKRDGRGFYALLKQ